ncbi:TetR family transcriptional regulator [Nocardia tenerifensis]|uniref:TetR family transcriptional regulator n=1 Tax=Nocardia tenerifensis TaxID=228006 RepID=A0A318JWQ4_9NOCA|nr:TetR/AcrR family transcriptional regulator [Nocardia tenerifensis]PXX57899.1 TetR family transcriptional regulator [Nocardia tenerifensis]
MTNSAAGERPKGGKRERLGTAAARVFHEQGVEKTTIAHIATAADVPLGNVYYYFKTKDQLVQAAIGAHDQALNALIEQLEQLSTPQDRLKALIGGWVDERETAARFGCPSGTLAAELDKRADGLDRELADVMRRLVDWAEAQFEAMGRVDAKELAVALIAAYQGISLLTNTFREPELMEREGERLARWIDSLHT